MNNNNYFIAIFSHISLFIYHFTIINHLSQIINIFTICYLVIRA